IKGATQVGQPRRQGIWTRAGSPCRSLLRSLSRLLFLRCTFASLFVHVFIGALEEAIQEAHDRSLASEEAFCCTLEAADRPLDAAHQAADCRQQLLELVEHEVDRCCDSKDRSENL